MLRLSDTFENPYKYIHKCIALNKPLEESSLDLESTKNEIQKDIPRTHLITNNKKEQKQLMGILIALAYIKPSIGYCQGMNFLGAVLLKIVKSEEIAFLLLLGMIKKWDMENMYVPGVPDLSLREYQMDYYLNTIVPDLYSHFRKVGITNGFFISRWFMTLFSTYLPLDTLVRVWDCFFLDGWKVIIKVNIALLRDIRPLILQYDLEEISSFLRINNDHSNYKHLLFKSKAVKVTKKELKKIEEHFYIEQANLKLAAIENSHSLSEKELNVMRWAKNEIDTFEGSNKHDVSEIWKKIEKIDQEVGNFSKNYLIVSMEFLRIKHEMEVLIEKKNLYNRNYQEMKNEYKKSKFPRFLMKLMGNKKKLNPQSGFVNKNISIQDIKMCEDKLFKVTQELFDLQKQYRDKSKTYVEVSIRAQEIKEKKKIYSEQLCDFLNDYK